jgi:hypothetical protein
MKEYTVTTTYELAVTVTVHVPDDMDVAEVQELFEDLPISVTVEPEWDDTDFGDATCDKNLSVDGLVASRLAPAVYHEGILQTYGKLI